MQARLLTSTWESFGGWGKTEAQTPTLHSAASRCLQRKRARSLNELLLPGLPELPLRLRWRKSLPEFLDDQQVRLDVGQTWHICEAFGGPGHYNPVCSSEGH